jgi:hypothetical protein
MARKSTLRGLRQAAIAVIILATLSTSSIAKDSKKARPSEQVSVTPAALWLNPTDIASRDLFYGPGGKDDAPHTVFTFVKEDRSGTNPKFDVHDENGVKWKVKLGVEAKPETVATRFVWAVGYYANEDYFLHELRVENLPHLSRGQNLVGPDGTIRDVRLKRYVEGEKKVGEWKWSENPFTSQRELNGLRVMMALLNNWDLKDENNAVYDEKSKDIDDPKVHYLVSDLGASFGTTGRGLTHSASKGNLHSYRRSKFISKVTPEYVDFNVPSRPALIYVFTPKEFASRMDMRWIGKHIPRSDAKWIGGLLAQLSPQQIRDAFRAADYSPEQIEGFAAVVEQRIAELNKL